MKIETLDVTDRKDYDEHEQVLWCSDAESGLEALIAIHSTQLGPALGGCRIYPYAEREDAIRDVLRLARGMTYKSAVAGLDLGGGKSVIIADPTAGKSPELLRAMGRFIHALGGSYIAAEDSGSGVDDMRIMHEETPYVAGIMNKVGRDGEARSGDPSPSTALGVLAGMKSALAQRFDSGSLSGVRVAIQGVGHVGRVLARYLSCEGAELTIADVDPAHLEQALAQVNARVVDADQVLSARVDVIAPCAMGAVINSITLPGIHAQIVAGAANNQLATREDGAALHQRGILYAPDYVINAGGIIDIAHESDYRPDQVTRHILSIGDTLTEIFYRATEQDLPTAEIADELVRERLRGMTGSHAASG